MKFAPRLFATALALAAVTSVSAQVINFDNLAGGPVGGGEIVTNQYAGLGVTFSDTYAGGAHANNTLGADITMAAYSGASLIGSVTLTGAVITGDIRSGLISLTDAGITSVRLFSHSGNSSFNFSIDNLTWQTAAVPEPSTYAMLFAGLGVVGWAARRRQHAAR